MFSLVHRPIATIRAGLVRLLGRHAAAERPSPALLHLHARLSTAHVRMRLGHQMILDLNSSEQRSAFLSRSYDPRTIDLCAGLLGPEAVALDIGAHVGLYACALGMHVRERRGRVFAFEPVAANYSRLRENVALNLLDGVVEPVRAALGRTAGTLELFVVPGSLTNNAVGENMLAESDRRNVARGKWRRDTAPLMRLDDWARERRVGRCDLIKIDVEGAELEVFAGGPNFIAEHRPVIIAEFNPYWMGQVGQSFEDVRARFEPLGYRFYREIRGQFLPVTPERVAKTGEVPTYVLLPPGRSLERGLPA